MPGSGTRDQRVPCRRSTAVKAVPVQTDQAPSPEPALTVPVTASSDGPMVATTRQPAGPVVFAAAALPAITALASIAPWLAVDSVGTGRPAITPTTAVASSAAASTAGASRVR